MLGSGAMTNSIEDVTRKAEVIMLVGSNPEEAHPVIGMQIRAAVERGCRLIAVDPRDIGLAAHADIHLKLRPGTNVAFANGIVNVSAKDLGTGKEQHITISSSSNMSKEDIDKAVKAAEQFAEEDKKRREEVEMKNNAENMCYSADKLISDNGDKLDEADKNELNSKSAALRSAIQSGTTETIKAGMDDLQKAMYAVSEKLYKASAPQDQQPPYGGAPGAGPQAGGEQGGANGDVYDADYKDVE